MVPQPNSKKINDLAVAQAGAYADEIDGKSLPDLLQEIIDAINELDAGNGSGGGDTVTGVTFDAGTRTLVITTDENPSGISVVIPAGSVSGGDGKLDGLTLDKNVVDVTLEASVSDGSTVSVSLDPLRNRIYPVADIAARNAIANPNQGSIAFIDDADGNGNPGISGFADPGWTTPFVITSGGGGGVSVAHDSLSSGNFTAEIDRLGGVATTLANPSAGQYDLTVGAGAHLDVVSIQGDNSTLNASQEMVINIDNSANSRDRRFLVQLYDANSGALVDQQLTGTVHNQAVSGNVTTITIPGLNGFGATGYIIELR